MDPLDFLNVADGLCNSDAESDRRTSVGRSYFALFNCLRTKLEGIATLPANDEAHKAVAYYLRRANNRELASIGQSLTDLRVSRNGADYELESVVDRADSQLALARARRAVSKLQALGDGRLANCVRAVPSFQSDRETR